MFGELRFFMGARNEDTSVILRNLTRTVIWSSVSFCFQRVMRCYPSVLFYALYCLRPHCALCTVLQNSVVILFLCHGSLGWPVQISMEYLLVVVHVCNEKYATNTGVQH